MSCHSIKPLLVSCTYSLKNNRFLISINTTKSTAPAKQALKKQTRFLKPSNFSLNPLQSLPSSHLYSGYFLFPFQLYSFSRIWQKSFCFPFFSFSRHATAQKPNFDFFSSHCSHVSHEVKKAGKGNKSPPVNKTKKKSFSGKLCLFPLSLSSPSLSLSNFLIINSRHKRNERNRYFLSIVRKTNKKRERERNISSIELVAIRSKRGNRTPNPFFPSPPQPPPSLKPPPCSDSIIL